MNDSKHHVRRGSVQSVVAWTFAVALAIGGTILALAIQRAREAAIASGSEGRLNQLQLAFHNYHDTYGCFPPAYVLDAKGNRMHSWRALILPFVDAQDVAAEYDYSEPWNSPRNQRLADRMPAAFRQIRVPDTSHVTNFAVVVGPETPFPGSRSTSLHDFKDGLGSTVLLIETFNANIPWMEPRDLDAATMSYQINDPTKPGPSSPRRTGPYVVFADRITAYSLTKDLQPQTLKALTTLSSGDPVCMALVDRSGGYKDLITIGGGDGTDADLVAYADWAQVKDLWLSNTRTTSAGLKALGSFDGQALDLSGMALTGKSLRELRLARLSELSLANTPLTDADIEPLAEALSLSGLNLSRTRITDEGLKHLRRFAGLMRLDVSGTLVTDAGLQILPVFPGWLYVNARDTAVTLKGAIQACGPPGRRVVAFDQGEVSEPYVNLSRSSVTDNDLKPLADASWAERIDLSHTRVTDAGLVHLEACSKLTNLDVRETAVTEAGLARLKAKIPDLQVVR